MTKKFYWSFRSLTILSFVFSISMLGISLVLQYFGKQEPCPLCLIDRFIVMIIGIVLGLNILFKPKRFIINLSMALLASTLVLLGIGISARHVWLTTLPQELVPACGPSLEYLIKNFPLRDIIEAVLLGSGECAKKTDVLLGIALPNLTLAAFILLSIMTLVSIHLLIKKRG